MATNPLFHKIANVLKKRQGPMGKVVPFAVGRVYATVYRNWHHDPKPLLFIIGSDNFYTVGINVHYLGSMQNSLINFIWTLNKTNAVQTSYTIYKLLKSRLPMAPRVAYRKYFTSMLRGRLVSQGISSTPDPNIIKFLQEPWVRRLNALLEPRSISYKNPQISKAAEESVRDQTIQTRYYRDKQKPFANKTVVQYRPQGE